MFLKEEYLMLRLIMIRVRNICVYFTGVEEGFPVQQNLCYEIDLRDYLPEWVWIGFSAATGMYSEFHKIHSWSCDSYFHSPSRPSPSPASSSSTDDKKFKTLMIVGWSVAAAGLILLASVITVYFCHKPDKNIPAPAQTDAYSSVVKSQNHEFNRVTGAKDIPYNVLARATNEFNEKNKLGQGGFGPVFRGYWTELHRDIAIKRISKSPLINFIIHNSFVRERVCHTTYVLCWSVI